MRLNSLYPCCTNPRISLTILSSGRLLTEPRISGIAQNEQQLSQPSVILIKAERGKFNNSGRRPQHTPSCAGLRNGRLCSVFCTAERYSAGAVSAIVFFLLSDTIVCPSADKDCSDWSLGCAGNSWSISMGSCDRSPLPNKASASSNSVLNISPYRSAKHPASKIFA